MDEAAAARVPWIGAQWDLIDLQVDQRGGRLSSSLTDNGTLRFRKGDAFRLAVLFFNGNDEAVDPAPTRLRWSLRDAANLELVAAVTLNNPAEQTDQSQPYYLLEPNIAALGGAAESLLDEDRGFLVCVMDVDWFIAGQTYSSQTLPAVVEFGLGSEISKQTPTAPSTPTAPTTPGTPTTPSTPTTPQPPTPPPLNEPALRALFDQWLLEALPVESGFLYVQNGQIVAAVPGGDCTTGETWTPT